MTTRKAVGIGLALLGLLTSFAEFALSWHARVRLHEHYDINPWVMMGGTVLACVGGLLVDFKRGSDIVHVVVSSGVTILGALPFGKRWTDRVADQVQHAVPEPVVTEEHDAN